jgi:hypothetical protein
MKKAHFQFTKLQVGPVSDNNHVEVLVDWSFTFLIDGHIVDLFAVAHDVNMSACIGDDCSLARLEIEDFGLGSSAKDVDSIRVSLQNPQVIVAVVQDKPVVTDRVFGCLHGFWKNLEFFF